MPRLLVGLVISVVVLGMPSAGAGAANLKVDPCLDATAILGTAGDDILLGTAGDDIISGLGGNDSIDGLAGNDYICGGPGDDVIRGGDGDDTIRAGRGDDTVRGEAGVDHLHGGAGSDVLQGGPQDDVIVGGDGADVIEGRFGADELAGGPGNDRIIGGSGGDVMRGGGGDDTLRGNEGFDELSGGAGHDTLRGGHSDDTLDGGMDDDVLYGRSGADSLFGRQGNDTIYGGRGADSLHGGLGLDTLVPGFGNDKCRDDGATVICPSAFGGEAIIADDQEPPTLNPFVPGGDNFIVSIIGQAHLAGVYDIDGYTLELIPELVTELPTVGNGGVTLNGDGTMTVRYTIRDEAVWSDGVPISGEDFEFTLQTILDPGTRVDKTTYEDITSWTVADKTFEYTVAEPTVLHEKLFKTIIPKHAVAGSDFNNDWNDTMWPAAGPFVFAEWDKGEHITFVRNENYWKIDVGTGQPLPFLDSVTFEFIPETRLLVEAFETRQVDVIQPPPDLAMIAELQLLESSGADVQVLGGQVWEHLNFQFGPGRLTRNPDSANENLNFRKGVAHTIDKQLLVDEIYDGLVDPLDSFVDAFTPTWSQDSWAQYDYNPSVADSYFAAAEHELGVDEIHVVFSTTSNNDARVRLAELLVDMFDAVDATYENQLEDSQIFFGETLDDGLWDMGEWAWAASPGLSGVDFIMDVWDPGSPPPEGSNFYRWGTPDSAVIDAATLRMAEIRDLMNETVDGDEVVALFNEAETLLADNVVIIPLYQRPEVAAVWADEIAGFKHNVSLAGHTWSIEYWHRNDL